MTFFLNEQFIIQSMKPDHGRHNISTYMKIEPTYEQKRREKEKKKRKKKSTRKKKKNMRDVEL